MNAATQKSDRDWMNDALTLARLAAEHDETPVGAVIVHKGQLAGQGYNLRESGQDVTLHAELLAIREACHNLGSWRLDDCVMYVTLEPCVMCAGAIVQSRIRRLCYGATDPKAGAAGSIVDIFSIRQNHQVEVTGGLLADASSQLLKSFFARLRCRDKAIGSRSRRREKATGAKPDADDSAADDSAGSSGNRTCC